MGRRGEAGWGGSGLGRAGCWWTLQGGGSGRGDRLGEAPRATALSFFAFFRAWVSPVLLLVAAMWVPPFHFLSVDFLLPYRLLCNASVSQELFTPLVRGTMLCRHHQIRSAACWALLCVYQCVQVRVSVCGGRRPLFSGWPTPASLAHPGGAKTQFTTIHALHVPLLSQHTHTRIRSASNGKPVSDQLRFFCIFDFGDGVGEAYLTLSISENRVKYNPSEHTDTVKYD